MAEKKPAKKRSIGEIAMWGLMALLVLGLGGVGLTDAFSGQLQRVARVGDKDIDINIYARNLQGQIQQLSQQTGRQISFAEARASGIDQAVLENLMRERALDYEASQMGISIGDENLRDQILEIPAFQGLNGTFDREGYRFSLGNSGLTESQFEDRLREESARTILQAAVVSGVVMPDIYTDTLVNFAGETRNFTWARLDQDDLDTALEPADDATLLAFYEDNIDRFQLPESKRITYAILKPLDLIDQVDLPDETLQEEYNARLSDFNQPERRLVERLVYLDDAAAEAAAAQLDVGTTFETLVAERGLTLQDVDMGDVGRLELDAAGEAVFNADVGQVIGPLPSPLGPALFRLNGVLPAQSRSFEEVKEQLRLRLAATASRRLVAAQAQSYDDLLAGGATLEDLVEETDMTLGTIDWYPALGDGIAAYDEFSAAATALTEEDFPQIMGLVDGSIFAMRLDEILPERPTPFDIARDNVQGNWEADRAEGLLNAKADTVLPSLKEGQDFAEAGLEPTAEVNLDRNAVISGTPTDFLSQIFEMNPGDVRVVSAFGAVTIVRLDQINPASENAAIQELREGFHAETAGALARDLFAAFTSDTMLRAGREVDARALNAVHANFH